MTFPPPPPYGEYPPTPPGSGADHDYYSPPGAVGQAQPRGTNTLAIVSLICAFLFFPLGIVFGHISLSQIRRSHEEGRGLAIAGLVISYVVAVLTVLAVIGTIVLGAALVHVFSELDGNRESSAPYGSTADPFPPAQSAGALPPFEAPANLGANCQYPASIEPASKPVQPPRAGRVPTTPATVGATIVTNDGSIGLQLANGMSPCTVNNFASLAQQGFFDNTPCHRLTTGGDLSVLQCGDPTGQGTGGPGYRFPNEYPTNQYRLTDPALQQPLLYPRGTLAMANAGPGTNGSQFFLVYADSQLPPGYTVFGTVDDVGLTVIDQIAAGGVQGGGNDGTPSKTVTIQSVRLD